MTTHATDTCEHCGAATRDSFGALYAGNEPHACAICLREIAQDREELEDGDTCPECDGPLAFDGHCGWCHDDEEEGDE